VYHRVSPPPVWVIGVEAGTFGQPTRIRTNAARFAVRPRSCREQGGVRSRRSGQFGIGHESTAKKASTGPLPTPIIRQRGARRHPAGRGLPVRRRADALFRDRRGARNAPIMSVWNRRSRSKPPEGMRVERAREHATLRVGLRTGRLRTGRRVGVDIDRMNGFWLVWSVTA